MQRMAMAPAGLGREEKAVRLNGAVLAVFANLQVTVMHEIALWVQLRERYFHPVRERIGGGVGRQMGRGREPDGLEKALAYAHLNSPPETGVPIISSDPGSARGSSSRLSFGR